MPTTLDVNGILRATGPGEGRSVAGFRLTATVHRAVAITEGSDDTVDLLSSGSAVVGSDGTFGLLMTGDGPATSPISITVSTPEGALVHTASVAADQLGEPLVIEVDGLAPLEITPAADPGQGVRLSITGRVIDASGAQVPSGRPVVLWGVDADDDIAAHPLVVTTTQAGGYFSADWVSTTLKSAFARVAGRAPIALTLDAADRLPRQVLLVLEGPDGADAAKDATSDSGADGADAGGCHGTKPPAAPNQVDLTTNPAAFSQDLGRGCVDLTTPNRVVEEFSYTTVVRTSEPDVRGVTFGARRLVPRDAFGGLLEAAALHDAVTLGRVSPVRSDELDDLSLDVVTAQQLVVGDEPPTLVDIKRAAWLSESSWLKDLIGGVVAPAPVRQPLDADHPIDWDDTPTVYQAITIARGHMLQMREVWRADGYSLGDLLYSLPLAPGQRRRIAVVDWERRSTTTRAESLEFEEELDAFTGRDRDISEIVGSRLSEQVAAGSDNTTWGVAGGIGAGFISGAFGIFGGVAGSHGGSESNAWQDSARQFAGDSLQSLRDRVRQRSSAVRDQRSTVVQTAAQGETMRAETEVVANYNHCHAMTVEYFEVLRHFLVTHEIADVRECLFVPLPMSAFDRAKALRWQTPLTTRLRDRSLRPGFDATRRIADNWVGWDYPLARYSEESPEELEGELRVSFVLPRPRDAADGSFQIDAWKPYQSWLWMDPCELWTKQIQAGIAEINVTTIALRDRQFREQIAPEIAKRVVERLRFWYIDEDGGETEAPLDATLVSRYAEGVSLYVTLRPRGALPPVPREKIAQLKITLDTQFLPPFHIPLPVLPPDAQVIVQSGKVRYRTEHKRFVLFDESRILNDLSENDAVFIPTPTSWAERRNPREEDRRLSDRLIAHLNNGLEYYHQILWSWLDPQRRFMLLDGVRVPGLNGRSVASVVENSVIGVAGNSLIMPLAPGIRLDPRVNTDSEGSLRDLYSADAPAPTRISVPTRGVYAEALLGDCDGCEEIDDSRYWRWSDAGLLAPPDIAAVDTASRADPETPLTPTPLPSPLVQIQNAPALPTPVGLADVFKVLAKPDTFTDITGLEGTQKNARAAFDSALSAASSVASQAAGIVKQNITATSGERMLDRIGQAQKDGLLTSGVATDLSTKVLGTMVGQPDAAADKKAASPVSDPDVQKAIDKAAQSDKADIKVSTADESLEMSFDGGDTKVGAASTVAGLISPDPERFADIVIVSETESVAPTHDHFQIAKKSLLTRAALTASFPAQVATITASGHLIANPADATRYQLHQRLRIQYPADPADPSKAAGTDRMPLAVLVHGQHESWQAGGDIENWKGYDYLQQMLARAGIVSVSVDTNAANFFGSKVETRAQMILQAIDEVLALDARTGHPLFGRIDRDRIGLMGHSRGGDAVVHAAVLNGDHAHGTIRAVASVAPTDSTGMLAVPERSVMTADNAGFYFVLYGGLDGDVGGAGGARDFWGTGFRHYDRATAEKSMVYLPGCSHNRFNRTWSQDDSRLQTADLPRVHSRADHETLMMEYVGGLFEWKLLGVTARARRFSGFAANSLGHPTSIQWAFGSPMKALDELETPLGTTGTRTTASADVQPLADVVVAGAPLEPHTAHQTRLMATRANLASPTAVYELALDAAQRDWSGFSTLTFRVGTYIDVTSAASIQAGDPQPPFAIVLIDGKGKSVSLPSTLLTTPTLPGRPVFHLYGEAGTTPVNASLHRLATVAFTLQPLALTQNDIRTLRVVAGPNFAQRSFFDSFRLVNP